MEEPGEKQTKNTNYGACAFWCLILLLISIGGLVFAVVYILEVGLDGEPEEISTTPAPPPSTMCETPECVSRAAALLETMDTSINPCNDFYEFACGSWIKSAIIPDGEQIITTMYSKQDQQRDFRVLLETPAIRDEPEAITKAKALYSSCMDTELRESIGVNDINTGVQTVFGGWPVLENNPGGNFDETQFDLTDLVASLFKDAGSTSLLRATAVKSHQGNASDEHILRISAGTFTVLPSAEYVTDSKYKAEQDAYVKYITDVAILLGADPDVAVPEMLAVFDLEKQLAQALLGSEATPENFKTVAEMQTLYPEIDWTVLLQHLVPDTVATITDEFIVEDYDSVYLRKALDIVTSVPARLQADWALWLCYEDATPYLNDAIRAALLEYRQAVYGTPPTEHYQDCVDLVSTHLHTALGRLYVDQHLTPEMKESISDIFESIKAAHISLVEGSELDDMMKEWALEALKNVTVSLGIPEYILDNDLLNQEYETYALPGDKIFDNFLSTLSFRIQQNIALLSNDGFENDYLAKSNNGEKTEIGLPPQAAQPPLFNAEWPWFLNFGNIGAKLGDILSQMFTRAPHYQESAQCLQDQYSEFYFYENGKSLTFEANEVLGDNAGLEIATKAFLDELWTRDLQTLPGIWLTPQQLFFLNNAQASCDKHTTEYADTFDTAKTPRSIPGRFRVNGMLQNSEAFASAFECSEGTRMNPTDKCTVYN